MLLASNEDLGWDKVKLFTGFEVTTFTWLLDSVSRHKYGFYQFFYQFYQLNDISSVLFPVECQYTQRMLGDMIRLFLFCLGACDLWYLFLTTFDTRYLAFSNLTPPRMFLPLDLLSEYRIQHGAIGPLLCHIYSYSTWIFCRGVSGFATDCPCGVWCRGLTTCSLYVGPLFGNRLLNNSWAVGLT